MQTHVRLVLVGVLAVLLAGCGVLRHKATAVRTYTEPHVAGSSLTVESRNGSVRITTDPSLAEVEITAKITCVGDTQQEAEQRLAQTKLRVVRRGDGELRIKPIFSGGAKSGDGATITVQLPDADGVSVDTSNGKVSVKGLTGELVIDTSNGSVTVTAHHGPARIDTSNGSIEVADHVGSLAIDTSNGSIRVADHVGPLVIDTSNGSVRVENLDGPATVDSSNGSIVLSLVPDQIGPLELDTSNASIRVRVGPGFVGPVVLDTSNSSIVVTDGLGRVTKQTLGKSNGRVVVGEGGKASRLDTSNGRIEFTIEG